MGLNVSMEFMASEMISDLYKNLHTLLLLLLGHIDPLLGNDNETTAVARQRPGHQYTGCRAVFSTRSVWRGYKRNKVERLVLHVEAGSNTSTVAPASNRRRRKGNPVAGCITGPPCSWGYKYVDLALQVWGVSNLRK
jgi:hypothetical protein